MINIYTLKKYKLYFECIRDKLGKFILHPAWQKAVNREGYSIYGLIKLVANIRSKKLKLFFATRFYYSLRLVLVVTSYTEYTRLYYSIRLVLIVTLYTEHIKSRKWISFLPLNVTKV